VTIEQASVRVVHKPWGSTDLRPWSENATIRELWYERANLASPEPALLLKLLFTNEPLSIQVHPDDVFANRGSTPNPKLLDTHSPIHRFSEPHFHHRVIAGLPAHIKETQQ
jgi:mannose-6-phosphate isomerase